MFLANRPVGDFYKGLRYTEILENILYSHPINKIGHKISAGSSLHKYASICNYKLSYKLS